MPTTRSRRGGGGGEDEHAEDEGPSGRPRRTVRIASASASNGHAQEARRSSRSTAQHQASSPDPLGEDIPANDAKPDQYGDEEDEDEDAEGEVEEEDEEDDAPVRHTRSGRTARTTYREPSYEDDPKIKSDSDSDAGPRSNRRRGGLNDSVRDFVAEDDDEDGNPEGEYGAKRPRLKKATKEGRLQELAAKRNRGRRNDSEDRFDENRETPEDTDGGGSQNKYRFRHRKAVNYSLLPPPPSPPRDAFGRQTGGRGGKGGGKSANYELEGVGRQPFSYGALPMRKGKEGWDALPISMSGKDYAKAFGEEPDSSDEDIPAARKAGGAGLLGSGGAAGGLLAPGASGGAGGAPGADLGQTRDAHGRMKKDSDLADADPLGVNMQVDFNAVGGLDGHVQQLKEMVSLPLLYPEVFQRFKVTPPRGVLFHGPPGTGKTLVARALAASCSSSGQPITFFMRKGADCLSKWVGEAERQLRLLFEEARASQPSIIFFDEIDGLAPVRSSKQDQIHASIVSTLLALMDGMDGRGQVVVIGATNRPDSVDPALRRPGRFDREFYFGLPNREARRSIIDIHTREWEPPLDAAFKDRLAEVTKGYGGADLRALCTEAALNAIQRRYPQIYQTTERLLLKPETISVDAKDFMMSVNKVVPSSARSASSAAAPLAAHLKPLLGPTVDEAIEALKKVLPPVNKRNPLEEALWEDDAVAGGSSAADGGFGREMLLQSFEKLRVFRPRLLIHGREGMGQAIAGAALLHHLEGYHVQSLDIATLMGDSARTPEAAIVQLFVEAKRHKPSVLFIPGLVHWSNSISESVRATTKALLDGLAPADPILLLAVAEAPISELPPDVRSWFGYLRDNKVEIRTPDLGAREAFFKEVLDHAARPPTEFPDAVPRRKRVLEQLPIAPPRAPREPTAHELAQQANDDQRLLEHLKHRLGLVLVEVRKKFKKFTRDVWEEYNLHELTNRFEWKREKGKIIVTILYDRDTVLANRRPSSVEPISGAEFAAGPSSAPAATAEAAPVPAPTVEAEAVEIPVNGVDVSMADATADADADADADAEPESSPAPHVMPIAPDGSALGLPAATATQDASNGDEVPGAPGLRISAKDPNYLERDMTIYTMTLEKMQKRLYHNGYLSVAGFLEDVNKIVFNADQAQEVDTERLTRAHQLRNATIILLDNVIDAPFRADCDKMAARMLAREKAEAEAAAAKAAGAVVPSKPPAPVAERQSARVAGTAPDYAAPVDVGALERENKRARRSDDKAGDSGDDGGARKRVRQDNDVMMGLSAEGADLFARGASSITVASGSAQAQALLPPAGSLLPGGSPLKQSLALPAEDEPSGPRTPIHVPPAPVPGLPSAILDAPSTPAAAPVHPPFKVSMPALSKLMADILARTYNFNIEQLEQLRATCFDAVWRHRADWDRSRLLALLNELSIDVARAVNDELDELKRLEAEMLSARDGM